MKRKFVALFGGLLAIMSGCSDAPDYQQNVSPSATPAERTQTATASVQPSRTPTKTVTAAPTSTASPTFTSTPNCPGDGDRIIATTTTDQIVVVRFPGATVTQFAPDYGRLTCGAHDVFAHVPCSYAPEVCGTAEGNFPVCSGLFASPVDLGALLLVPDICPVAGVESFLFDATVQCSDAQVSIEVVVEVYHPGDCDHDGRVSDDELALLTFAGFDRSIVTRCPGLDRNRDGGFDASEFVWVVSNRECDLPEPTPGAAV